MSRFTLKPLSLLALGLIALLASALGAQASSQPNRKQRRAERRSERRIVEPSLRTVEAVDSFVARTGDVAVTWSDRGIPMAVYGKMGDYGGATEAAARSFLSLSPELFGLQQDLSDLTLVSEKQSPGGTHLTFQQDFHGVKVFGAQMSVNFDPNGEVTVVGGDYFDRIDLASVEPTVSIDEARVLIGERLRDSAGVEPTLTEIVVYVNAEGTAFLAHHIIQPTVSPVRGAGPTYEFFIDAATGTVIGRPRDINMYATGQVFKNGNAMAATGNSALEDTSTIPSTAYQTVTLQGLTSTTGLVGSFCDTHTLTASTFRAVPVSGNYTHTRSTTAATGAKFDAVNTYYYVDETQRYIQSLGFTNVNNRSVRFNINGTADDQSWYQPNGSGTGDLTIGYGGVDDGEDAEVVLHEYGHSIHDNSKAGVWGGAVTGAMGEGWGDYIGASVTAQRYGQAGTAYETAVMEWDASSYSSAVPPTIRSITSSKHYPENWTNEVHADGELWSSTLWQIRSDFIGLNGTATGVQRADRVILQSHFLMTSSSNTFVDGANSVLQAAINLGYTAAEQDAIRARLTARGMAPTIGGGGCTYSISPTSSSPAATATTGSVSVSAGTGCTWTATSNASWLTITSGASGSGNGSVGYSVLANSGAARIGTLTIAGRTFTVNQDAGTTCSSSTTPITSGSSLSGSLATTDCKSTIRTSGTSTFYYDNFTFSATAGTAYTITLNAPFDAYVYLLSGSTVLAQDDDGNGGTNSKIVYTPTTSGTLTIHCTSYTASSVGTYTVALSGGSSCTYSISPLSASPTAAATTGTVSVTAGTGCAWTATSGVAWLTITSGASGSGNGTVGYSVAANTGAARSGTMTIAGRTFTVNQASGSTELVANGGFETTASWTFGTYASRDSLTAPQSGSWSAKFLGRAATTSSGATAWQTPAFPTTGATRTLRFYMKISTAETGSTAYDKLFVRIRNSTGSTIRTTMATYSNANSGAYTNWTLVTLTIPSSYAVSGNRLYFEGTEDVSLQTTFWIDAVSIQ